MLLDLSWARQAGRREADWFRESEDMLRPLFEMRRQLFTQEEVCGRMSESQEFCLRW